MAGTSNRKLGPREFNSQTSINAPSTSEGDDIAPLVDEGRPSQGGDEETRTGYQHTMSLINGAYKARKGRCVKRFVSAEEFFITMDFTLEEMEKKRCSLVNICVDTMVASCLPKFTILPPVFQVEILSGHHLDRENPDAPLFVTCERKGFGRNALFHTEAYRGDHPMEPTWDKVHVCQSLLSEDKLGFKVWEKLQGHNNLLYKGRIDDDFFNGWTGEVHLTTQGVDAENSAKGTPRTPRSGTPPGSSRSPGDKQAPPGSGRKNAKEATPRGPFRTASQKAILKVKVSHIIGNRLECVISAGKSLKILDPVNVPVKENVMVKFALELEPQRHGISEYRVIMESRAASDEEMVKQTATIPGLKLPKPMKLFVYISGREDRSANAVVQHLVYHWRTHENRLQQTDLDEANLRIPEEEQKILKKLAKEMKMANKWQTFDAIFGIILVINCIQIGVQLEYQTRHPNAVSEHTWNFLELAFLIIFTVELFWRLTIVGWKVAVARYKQRKMDQKGETIDMEEGFEDIEDEEDRMEEAKEILDYWLLFDAFILLISYASYIIDTMYGSFNGVNMSFLRLIRLLKLIKMIRLIRAFRALGLLVDAMYRSIPYLFWTCVCLALVIFIGASMTATMAIELIALHKDDPVDYKNTTAGKELTSWEKMSSSFWNLLVMSTYDRWGYTIRTLFDKSGDWKGGLMAVCCLIVMTVVAVGVFNMMVGLMCYTACYVDQSEGRRVEAEKLEAKQAALTNIREIFRSYGPRPIFKSSRFLEKREFFEAIEVLAPSQESLDGNDDFQTSGQGNKALQQEIKLTFDDLELNYYDLVALATAFEENNQIDIDGLIEGIAVLELQRFYARRESSVEGELFGSAAGGLRPLDMLFFKICMEDMEKEVTEVERCVMGQTSITTDLVKACNNALFQAHTLASLDEEALNVSGEREAVARRNKMMEKPMNIQALVRNIMEYRASLAAQGLEHFIDILFGCLILFNAVFLGFQITDVQGQTDVKYIVPDLIFTVVFTCELIIRLVLLSNMKDVQLSRDYDLDEKVIHGSGMDDHVYSLAKVEHLRSRMILHIIPPMPQGRYTQVLATIPLFLSDAVTLFDTLIVLFSLVDSIVLCTIRLAVEDADVPDLTIFRVMRLARLVKLVRIVRLFPALQKLLLVFMETANLVYRQYIIMFIMFYSFAILMMFCINSDESPPLLNHYFDGILSGSITAFQLIIFDQWYEIMTVTAENGYLELVILVELPLVIIGVMFLNSMVGMFCTAAVTLVKQKQVANRHKSYLTVLSAMGELAKLLRDELGTHTVSQEMLEEALRVKFRPVKIDIAGRYGQYAKENLPEVRQKSVAPEFVEKLREVLMQADMVPVVWKQIFEKVDYDHRGILSIDHFALGAILLRVDLEQLDIFSASTSLRLVREKCAEVKVLEQKCHYHLEMLLRHINESCHQKGEDDFEMPYAPDAERDLLHLSPKGETALRELKQINEGGTRDQSFYRDFKLIAERGQGKVKKENEYDDGCFQLVGTTKEINSDFDNTDFRKHIEAGDILLIEMQNLEKRHKSADLEFYDTLERNQNESLGQGEQKNKSEDEERREMKALKNATYAPVKVITVLDNTSLKVKPDEKTYTKSANTWSSYKILRKDPIDKDPTYFPERYIKPLHPSYMPFNAAQMFEWQVNSTVKRTQMLEQLQSDIKYHMRKRGRVQTTKADIGVGERLVDLLSEEQEALKNEYKAVQNLFKPLRDRFILRKAFEVMKGGRKDTKKWRRGHSPSSTGASGARSAPSNRSRSPDSRQPGLGGLSARSSSEIRAETRPRAAGKARPQPSATDDAMQLRTAAGETSPPRSSLSSRLAAGRSNSRGNGIEGDSGNPGGSAPATDTPEQPPPLPPPAKPPADDASQKSWWNF